MSTAKTTAPLAELTASSAPTPSVERLASNLCDHIEAYLRRGDDCIPARFRDMTEEKIAEAILGLRAQVEQIEPDAIGDRLLCATYFQLRAPEVARLKATLQRVYEEVRDYVDYRDQTVRSSDSYLPPALVDEIATVLGHAAGGGAS